jgi:hypothetical protein
MGMKNEEISCLELNATYTRVLLKGGVEEVEEGVRIIDRGVL